MLTKTGYKYFNKVTVLVLCIILAGCETIASTEQSSAEKDATNKVVSENSAASIETPLVSANDSILAMLRYSRFVNGLTKEQLADEFKRINDAYFMRPNDRSALKRAMLLMIPDTSFYDLNQAKQSFSDIVNSNDQSVPAFKEYAEFMISVIAFQEQANKRSSQLQEQLNQEIVRREKIEEKLEALKSIEENMTQRRNQ